MLHPQFFATKADLFQWFKKNYKKETEMLLGYYKKDSGKPSVSWPESVDVALCFGWIDGIRRSMGDESYNIRFTPRKPASIWSAVNIAKVEDLMAQGLMTPEGIAAFEKRKENKSRIYAYEQETVTLSTAYEKQFKANKGAWKFFGSMAPWYQKTATNWVMSAKQESTRNSRMKTLIEDSAAERKIKSLSYDKKKPAS
ncbi:MAG: YdeI/OmpD-associated family protein [Bacteroidota bacterium]